MTNTLEMSLFLKYRQCKSKQFKQNAVAPQIFFCFTILILVNLVANLTVSHSQTLNC